MRFLDKNQTLEPPEGYRFVKCTPCGAYLVLLYAQFVYDKEQRRNTGERYITIYLQDVGREVARTEDFVAFAANPPAPVMPDSCRFHFWHGWFSIRDGFQETVRCLLTKQKKEKV